MNWMLFGIGTLLLIFVAASLIPLNRTKPSELSKFTNFAGAAVIFSILGFLLYVTSDGIEEATMALIMINIAVAVFVISSGSFSLRVSRIRIPRRINILLIGYLVLEMGINLTIRILPYYYSNPRLETGFFMPRLVFNKEPLLYVDVIATVFFGLLFAYVVILHNHPKKKADAKGMFILGIWNIATPIFVVVDKLHLLDGIVIMPAVLTVVWFHLVRSIFKYNLFDSIQIAKEGILDTIEEGVIVIDPNQKVLICNERARKMFPELRYEATAGDMIDKLIKSDHSTIVQKEYRYQISVVPFYAQTSYKGSTIWISDTTEEYLATKKLIELKEEAERANAAKSVFLANMSHEIRTPMNAIIGMSEMILNDNINSNVEENARNIRNAGNMLLSIINGILDFSKIETGKMEMTEVEYNLGYIIKDISNMINLKLLDKNVEFIVHMKENIPTTLYGDETQVRQIFTNILTNAVKYTKRGYIRLNVDFEPIGEDAMIKVSIEDTGVGIREEHIATLFDSFQRADMIRNRTIEGTGLGLAICKRLVESMGGEISVKSSYGVGSVFSFTIVQKIHNAEPMGDYDSLELPGTGEHEKTFIAPLAKVLVVDDNITNIKVARGLLTMYQVRVDTALSGRECLEKIKKHNYHMIFMDHMMPEMDGIETTKLIRLDDNPVIRKIPIIALTANAIHGTREMFLQSGFQEYLSKPINLAGVESVLKKFLPAEIIHYVDKSDNDMDYSDYEIELPHVDVEAGLANYGNDKGKYLQILKFIYDDGEAHIHRIKDNLDGQHYREYVYEVHALKGLMAGIGANQLSEYAKLQEYAGRDGNVEVIKRESGFMLWQYEKMLENIKNLLNDCGLLREEITQIRDEELTWNEFCDMLHSLQASLDLLEQSEAARKADNLLTYPLDEAIRKQLVDIKHAINEFEYDEATSLIQQIL